MLSVLKRLAGLAVFLVLGLTAGAAGIADRPIESAYAGCENDECDKWLFWERCRNNPGGLTKCAIVGRGCMTLSCRQSYILE